MPPTATTEFILNGAYTSFSFLSLLFSEDEDEDAVTEFKDQVFEEDDDDEIGINDDIDNMPFLSLTCSITPPPAAATAVPAPLKGGNECTLSTTIQIMVRKSNILL